MRRTVLSLLVIGLAAVAIPPLWYRLFPVTEPELPAPGRRVVLASGVGLNVLEEGAGPPVLLVHGLPGSAYDWRLTSAALAAQGRRAIAYDRAGYGWSDAHPDGVASLASNATDLLQLLDALGLSGVTLVGHSYGGATAIVAATKDPSRIARIVLVASAGPGMEKAQPPQAVARVVFSEPVLRWLHAVPPLAHAAQDSASGAAFSGGPEPSWWAPTLAANFARPHTPDTWRKEGSGLASGPLPDASRIALPILVIHGDADRLVPVEVGRELARRARNARLVLVGGGSHMLPVTHAELLAADIASFH